MKGWVTAGEGAREGSVNLGGWRGVSGRSTEAEPVWLQRFTGSRLEAPGEREASLDTRV